MRDNEINNILNTLNDTHVPSIVISHKTYKGKYITDSITYDDEEKINFLFNYSELEESNIHLVIEDFNSFIAYDDNYINYIYKILKRSDSCNVRVILLTKQSISYYKIINLFKYRLAIGINDQNDLINIFGKKSEYVNDSYFYNGDSISIVPCILERYVESESVLTPLVIDIPEHIILKEENNYLYIGYDMVHRSHECVSLTDRTAIITINTSIYNKLSFLFDKYSNVEVYIYNPKINIEAYRNVMWVGPGLFKQRLIISDIKQDLKPDEAYIMNEKQGKVIRFVEYE